MAEANRAVAFQFEVTPDGEFEFNVNLGVIKTLLYGTQRGIYRRLRNIGNVLHNGLYPVKPFTLIMWTAGVGLTQHFLGDISFGLIEKIIYSATAQSLSAIHPKAPEVFAVVTYGSVSWLGLAFIVKKFLKLLLSYHGWMFGKPGKPSKLHMCYLFMVGLLSKRDPRLFSLQSSMPHLPLPGLGDTVDRYLVSMQPIVSEEEYRELKQKADEFKKGIGFKLQILMRIRWLFMTNYVSPWWEEFVYLRSKAPLMVNSNYYGTDLIGVHPTTNQAARAANITYFAFKFRQKIDRQRLEPIFIHTVPLCSGQYERMFNTVRIPKGNGEGDVLQHYSDSRHIVVMHKGRYFVVYVYRHGRLLEPDQIEQQFQMILDNTQPASIEEQHLAALTAADRERWLVARRYYFSKGVNRQSLDVIEKAAFVVCFDEEDGFFDTPEQRSQYGLTMLMGKTYDRWFDHSFNLILLKNGRFGMNCEHSWADAPIMCHVWEHCVMEDMITGYTTDGHTIPSENGTNVIDGVTLPGRLKWNIQPACYDLIKQSLDEARVLADNVDLQISLFDEYGKGFVKKFVKVSPDSFIQMALQLAQYRDQGRFCQTYEACMTRLFQRGRTDTIRSCSNESREFVLAMDDPSRTTSDRQALLRKACEHHQHLTRVALVGGAVDRHLFTLYVMSKIIGYEVPFLQRAMSTPWRLSTSQTALNQTTVFDCDLRPEIIPLGGGFGPVAEDGYGVSYFIGGNIVFGFHVSSSRKCSATDSTKFLGQIFRALRDMNVLFSTK